MKNLIVVILILTHFCAFAQISFEAGYFINEAGEKTECLIRNVDWKNNPDGFTYKIDETNPTQKAHISNIREFGIDGFSKFVKAEVKIDRSSELIQDFSEVAAPQFELEFYF